MKCVGPTLSKKDIQRLHADVRFTPNLDEVAARLAILANPTRLRMFYLMAELREVCVCDLADILGFSVSAVSQHLAKFKALGLVRTRREAQTLYYSLSDHPFNDAVRRSVLADVEL
jgi:DNA-binding transcriptional ArsR family regulator